MNEKTSKLKDLQQRLGSMGEMRVSSGVLGLMGTMAILLVAGGLWLTVKDLVGLRAFHRTTQQSEQSIQQLSAIASQLRQLVSDPQLQSLALQALEQEQSPSGEASAEEESSEPQYQRGPG